MKVDRTALVKSLSSEHPVSTVASLSTTSPSKEELKRNLEIMKIKLQLAYDNHSDKGFCFLLCFLNILFNDIFTILKCGQLLARFCCNIDGFITFSL